MTPHLDRLVDQERRRQAPALAAAALCAALGTASAALLLGLSGWFITASAIAGAAGSAVALTFNYVLPSAGIRLLAIVRTASRYGERIKGHEGALRALARIRPALFASLAAAPASFSLGLSGGEASARLIQDVNDIESRLVRLSSPWAAAAAALVGLLLTSLAGWGATLALALFLPVSVLGQRWLARRLSREPAAAIQRASGELKDAFAAYAQSAAELRCYALEDWAADEIQRRSGVLGDAQVRATRAQGWVAVFRTAMVGAAVALVLGLSAAAPLPLAALAALATIMALEGCESLTRAFEQESAADEAGQRLEHILSRGGADEAPMALSGSTLTIGSEVLAPGAALRLLGPSGAGKTRLFEQLVGLRQAQGGEIGVGGRDLAALPPGAARLAFAYAPQEIGLLAGTVRENLALGDPAASDEALWQALHDAGLDVRLRREAEGLDLWIGENGARLSGGERRRLGLARALLRPAPWLILDEPTEGLDPWTEALVVRRLRERLRRTGQGLLLATHRAAPASLAARSCEIPLCKSAASVAHTGNLLGVS